jgi:hypothetical protein
VSHHPDDIREGYCGRCHDWTGLPDGAAEELTRQLAALAVAIADALWAAFAPIVKAFTRAAEQLAAGDAARHEPGDPPW